MIMDTRLRWAGQVADMGREGIDTAYCWESHEEREHYNGGG
jgi:hypothetical protein